MYGLYSTNEEHDQRFCIICGQPVDILANGNKSMIVRCDLHLAVPDDKIDVAKTWYDATGRTDWDIE